MYARANVCKPGAFSQGIRFGYKASFPLERESVVQPRLSRTTPSWVYGRGTRTPKDKPCYRMCAFRPQDGPCPMPAVRPHARPPLAWLRAPGSLTRHLARVCPGRLVVEVLGEGWAKANSTSARLLGVRVGARVWRREVRLACRHAEAWTPYVHALTLGSPAAERGLGLARLGQRPLGSLLFRHGGRRLELVILPPGRSGPWWARRSLFLLRGHRLLVWEVFLDGLPPFRR